MTKSQLEDHVTGIELQIVEVVERRERALVQGQTAEAAALQAELDDLQADLMTTAERLAQPA